MAHEDDALFKAFLKTKKDKWSSKALDVIDRRSFLFNKDYFECLDRETEIPICFHCTSGPMEFQNFPCGCALWCSDFCSNWAYKEIEKHQKDSTKTPAIRCVYCSEDVYRMVRMASDQEILGDQNNERDTVFHALMEEWGSKNHSVKNKIPNPMHNKCMRCGEKEMVFKNSPCGCLVWCVDCLDWAINVVWPHQCLICNREVNAFGGEDGNLIYRRMMDDDKVFRRDAVFFKNYIRFKTSQTCFRCGKEPMEWRNLPCGCQLWCTKCKELVEYIVDMAKMEHLCTTCASPVNAMENYVKQPQFDRRYGVYPEKRTVSKQQKKKERREFKKNKVLCSGSSSSSTQVQQIPEGQGMMDSFGA